MCQQQRDLREYTQATIYIHKVVDNKKVRALLAPPGSASLNRSCAEHPEKDPDVVASQLPWPLCPRGVGTCWGGTLVVVGCSLQAGSTQLCSSYRFGTNSRWESSVCSCSDNLASSRFPFAKPTPLHYRVIFTDGSSLGYFKHWCNYFCLHNDLPRLYLFSSPSNICYFLSWLLK